MESFKEFADNAAAPDNHSEAAVDNSNPDSAAELPIPAQDGGAPAPLPPLDTSAVPALSLPDDESVAGSAVYPSLSNNPLDPVSTNGSGNAADDEDDIDMSKSFRRGPSPMPDVLNRNRRATVTRAGEDGEDGTMKMHKFQIWETANYYYILGADILETDWRILKIDRTAEPGELNIIEEDVVYTRKEANQIIRAIDEGNQVTGGIRLRDTCWGILGFIKFTGQYYMIYVAKRSQVAMIGGHYIYQIDKAETMPLLTHAASKARNDKHVDESRYLGILHNLDLTKSFYFSYSYDITRTLQHNIMRERQALTEGLPRPTHFDHNEMFVWNHHLLEPATTALRNPFDWCLTIVHGYVDQSALSVYWGRVVYVTIIARRSCLFAGARYLKRGTNDRGHVANDVETEQIVSEMLTTSFHAPGPKLFANPNYTSYVQHRGSIPLYWSQDSSGVSPKPDIHLNVIDPFFSAAAMHFDNLFERYGAPIYVLNLVKARERVPRESKLLKEYTTAVKYLNQFLPPDKKIIYHAWDMSRASKSRDQDVIGSLEAIADDILPRTGFFQNGDDAASGLKLQSGVARTNCIDCLDRTNAAQFVIAKKALGYQLKALGVIDDTNVEYDSDATNLFTHMWHDHGDTIAIQYGGSHLVNTMSTYRKINQWTSHSRDMVETFKRYYNNSFMDSQRQEAYNLFLGHHVYEKGQPMLWELSSDYYLHHSHPRSFLRQRRPSYRHWYTDKFLERPSIPPSTWPSNYRDLPVQCFDDYWVEYYRPLTLSTMQKLFPYKMHSTLRYIPIESTLDRKYDLSPFRVRTNETDGVHKHKGQHGRKGVKIITPSEDLASPRKTDTPSINAVLASPSIYDQPKPAKPTSLGPWLEAQQQMHASHRRYTGIIKESSFEVQSPQLPRVPQLPQGSLSTELTMPKEPAKAELALQAFTAMVVSSLNPTVKETEEYHRYVEHPAHIPLVTSTETDYSKAPSEFLEYLSKTQSAISKDVLGYAELGRGVVSLTLDERAETSVEEYTEFVESALRDDPLTVLEEDGTKKRYKAYRQWLRGKSLFKQRPFLGEVV
ncbi:hypothetical protein DV738_g4287, partial [Chaetothyriales sp. CBS 135597]